MKSFSRSLSRSFKSKALKRALEITKLIGSGTASNETLEQLKHRANRIKSNRKPCSCNLCCNPRHSIYFKGNHKLTIQERREIQKLQNELYEH